MTSSRARNGKYPCLAGAWPGSAPRRVSAGHLERNSHGRGFTHVYHGSLGRSCQDTALRILQRVYRGGGELSRHRKPDQSQSFMIGRLSERYNLTEMLSSEARRDALAAVPQFARKDKALVVASRISGVIRLSASRRPSQITRIEKLASAFKIGIKFPIVAI